MSAYSFLFADYFLALSKWFSNFTTYREDYDPVSQTKSIERPRVVYGQPSAAFRKMREDRDSLNGRIKLPVISFYASTFRRIKERQNPYATYSNSVLKAASGLVGQSRAAQVYEITYNISVWTNGNKSRDDLISRIVRAFNTSITLSYFPDPVAYPNDWIWMPFKIEDDITDATDLEVLDEKDTRDITRTDFVILGESLLPLETEFFNPITDISLVSKIESQTTANYTIKVFSQPGQPIEFEII